MKTLLLARHAKSSWKDQTLADSDRPLNNRGKRDAPRMGKRLANRQMQPDLVVSSPALRAMATAKAISAEIGYPAKDIVVDERVYHGGIAGILRAIHELDDAASCALLFGHNPELTDLVNQLARCSIDNVPTCGIAQIQFTATSWREIGDAGGQLVDFDYPKKFDD
jgi:phosphohistidine phosphatase